VAPEHDQLGGGRAGVATPTEIDRLAQLATDPFVAEVFAGLPRDEGTAVFRAVHDFGAGLYEAPVRSFQDFERSLLVVRRSSAAASTEPDAQIAQGVLDLYRELSAKTLFGADVDPLDTPVAAGWH
jgi:hypothetical protein